MKDANMLEELKGHQVAFSEEKVRLAKSPVHLKAFTEFAKVDLG